MNEKQQKYLANLQRAMEGAAVQPEELIPIIELLLSTISDVKTGIERQISDIRGGSSNSLKKISYSLSDLELKVKDLINKSEKASLSKIKELSQRLVSEIDRVEQLIPSLPDLSYLENKILEVERKIPQIPEPVKVELDTPEQLAQKINTLHGQIDMKVLRGWPDFERRININAHTPKDFDVRIGVSKTEVQGLRDRIALLESSSATLANSILSATGTIDDSNTAFTFTRKPTVIIYNGVAIIETGGAVTWSWDAGSLTATLSSPVGTGGSIFGLK
jgi:hypothetical protein